MNLLQNAFLCPGDESGAHITFNAVACECGNSNLASLARILDRVTEVPLAELEIEFSRLCQTDLPTMRKYFS